MAFGLERERYQMVVEQSANGGSSKPINEVIDDALMKASARIIRLNQLQVTHQELNASAEKAERPKKRVFEAAMNLKSKEIEEVRAELDSKKVPYKWM